MQVQAKLLVICSVLFIFQFSEPLGKIIRLGETVWGSIAQ